MPLDPAAWVLLALIALVIGSFLGVVITRLPAGEPILVGRSQCPHCHTRLAPWEMIPLLSFILQKGRCRHCHAPIDPIHWQIELAALAVAFLAASRAQTLDQLAAWCLLGFILLPLAWIDLRHFWLPDVIVLPGILTGLAACWWLTPYDLTAHAAGAAVGFLSLALIREIYRRLRHREGLGLGDAKLLALAGAWTGWQDLAAIMLEAAILGIAVTLITRAKGKLPLGAYMAPVIFLAALGWVI